MQDYKNNACEVRIENSVTKGSLLHTRPGFSAVFSRSRYICPIYSGTDKEGIWWYWRIILDSSPCFYGEISKIIPYHQIPSLYVPLYLGGMGMVHNARTFCPQYLMSVSAKLFVARNQTVMFVMSNSYPCDGIFNPLLKTVIDSFSSPWGRQLILNYHGSRPGS